MFIYCGLGEGRGIPGDAPVAVCRFIPAFGYPAMAPLPENSCYRSAPGLNGYRISRDLLP